MRALALAASGLMAACGQAPAAEPELRQSVAPQPWRLRDASLYLPISLIETRDPRSELGSYMRRLQDAASAVMAEAPVGRGVSGSIVIIVYPGRRALYEVVTGQPELPDDVRTSLISRLKQVTPPDFGGGPVMAGLNFDAWGGGGRPPNEPNPLPEEWISLLPAGGGRIDDAFIEQIWDKES